MILKEIYIYGFKSFANPTKIELGPGVTTIVGPNGCGKSNVVDAIRWVLGEQSAKALRGGKMFDVIFAGTDKREGAQECEVRLLFTECEEQLGTAFTEVEVSRKVTREGASKYQLNGKNCRLKDIQRLFMDTGVGQESYSFLMQGKIDQILSNNPTERRIIFEEAAGITKYKAQRREALNKLTQVDQNLARVVDIVDEVSKRMGSLKRQASKAIRFKRIKKRLTHLELGHLAWDYARKGQTVKTLESEMQGLDDAVQKARSKVDSLMDQCEEKKHERSQSAERLQQMQQEIFDLKSQKDRLENQSQLADVRQNDAKNRIQQIQTELESLSSQLIELEQQESSDAQSKQLQLDLVDNTDKVYQSKADQVAQVESQLRQLEQDYRDLRNNLTQQEGQLRRVENEKSQLELSARGDGAKFEEMEKRIQETQENLSQGKQQQSDLQETLSKQTTELTQIESQVSSLRDDLDSKNNSVRDVMAQVSEQDRKVARLNAQISVLESLQQKLEGFSEGAKAILQGKLTSQEDEKFEVLTQALQVKENYLAPFDALMGSAIDAIEVPESAKITQLFEKLEAQGLGKACLHFDGLAKPSAQYQETNLPEGILTAISVVQVKDQQHHTRWENLLKGCYIVDDLSSFLEYLESNSNFNFAYVATLNGELLDCRGFVYGGGKTTTHAGASYIKREAEIRELKTEITSQEESLASLQASLQNAQQQRETAETQLEQAKTTLVDLQRKETESSAQMRQITHTCERYQSDLARYQTELERLNQTHSAAETKIKDLSQAVHDHAHKLEQLRAQADTLEKNVDTIRNKRDQEQKELSELKLQAYEKKQQLEALDRELNEIGNKRTAIVRRQENLKTDIQRLKDDIVKYQDETQSAKTQSLELDKTLQAQSQQLQSQRDSYKTIEAAIKDFDLQLEALRQDMRKEEGELNQREVKLTKEKSAIEFMLEKAQMDYEVELQDLNWKEQIAQIGDDLDLSVDIDSDEAQEELLQEEDEIEIEIEFEDIDEPDWDTVNQEINELRKRIQGMGAVNLVAIEEYRELKDRHEFLTKQYDDLTSSKNQLMAAIEEINQVSQKLFIETFDKVRTNFHTTFDALFGGGHADLQLMEAEDVLDAGIEVTARPPGTKLRGLSLLSGGQKTMTAVALLFAIYKVKPSPFCVLDELDAPLDDANIGRFTTMLKEFTRYSQFLVISHNKRTIATSDSLYGVTMEEKGVTKMLSMRFNNKEQKDADQLDDLSKQAQETYVEATV